jgi:hypothetical protein
MAMPAKPRSETTGVVVATRGDADELESPPAGTNRGAGAVDGLVGSDGPKGAAPDGVEGSGPDG